MLGAIKTVGVYVEDPQVSLSFFTDKLGFEVRRREPLAGTDQEWIEVAPPGTATCLVVYARSMMNDWAERKASIVFHCKDIPAECQRLERLGVTLTMRPTKMEFGVFAAFEDPDGNQFGMTSQTLA